MDFATGKIRATEHRGDDDLLSAGLGLEGLRGRPSAFADPASPTPGELRRRAIQSGWKGIADLGPLGGYGDAYGGVPDVPGREFQAFARLPQARSSHRVLVQVPDAFDVSKRCLLVTASSGSRGVYGGMAIAAAWGLANGCAVVNTDKGAGTGYFDCADASGVALDGTRARAGDTELDFVADPRTIDAGIAVKHAHSQDNPEGDWGRHLLQAAQFGLAMLDRAFPQHAPFTPANTRVVAVGLSNGGGAALQAAGIDERGLLAGVVAIEPNIYAPRGAGARSMFDYACEAALWSPCALLDARFDTRALTHLPGSTIAGWHARSQSLHANGLLQAGSAGPPPERALARMKAKGWNDAVLASATASTAFDLWRALAITYASAYARAPLDAMPGGFRFATVDLAGKPHVATPQERAAWWCDASGIPPGNGIGVIDARKESADSAWNGLAELAALPNRDDVGSIVRASIEATQARLPRKDLPIFIVHGAEDGLIPPQFSSTPYVEWLRANGRRPLHWCVPHAQHFDAFLALPGFGDRYVPLLPYAYAAIAKMVAHVTTGTPLEATRTPAPTPRGASRLDPGHLDLSGIA